MRRSMGFGWVVLLACLIGSLAPRAVRASDRFVTVAPDVRLFVQEEGHGTPLIVIHGGPGLDSRSVEPDLKRLARRHRVIFYDQRGSGRSTLSAGVTADEMVQDLDALRRGLGLSRVALLGHSWGGGLAALYASAHPANVSRLVLVSPMPLRAATLDIMERNLVSGLTTEEYAKLREIMNARVSATTEEENVSSCREYRAILLKAYYADPAATALSRGEACAGPGAALASGLRVNSSVLRSLGNFDLTSKMSRLRMPDAHPPRRRRSAARRKRVRVGADGAGRAPAGPAEKRPRPVRRTAGSVLSRRRSVSRRAVAARGPMIHIRLARTTFVLAVLLTLGPWCAVPAFAAPPRWPEGALIRVWIDPRDVPPDAGEMVTRAVKTWSGAAAGRIALQMTSVENGASVHVMFIRDPSRYGETAPHVDRGGTIRSADVFINSLNAGDLLDRRIILYPDRAARARACAGAG